MGITISVQCVAGITQFITNKIKQELLPKYPNFHLILEVASGYKKVATDILGLYNDLVLFNPSPLT